MISSPFLVYLFGQNEYKKVEYLPNKLNYSIKLNNVVWIHMVDTIKLLIGWVAISFIFDAFLVS